MSVYHSLPAILERIWKYDDFEAVKLLRTKVREKNLTLYFDQQEDINYKPLFYKGEPLVHRFSPRAGSYSICIDELMAKINRNDIIGLKRDDIDYDSNSEPCSYVHFHLLSGLVYIFRGDKVLLFPHVSLRQNTGTFSAGHYVKYVTVVDQRRHYGEVVKVQCNRVYIKEYIGFQFESDGHKLSFQDNINYMRNQAYITCIPIGACTLLDENDYRVGDMRCASLLRQLWLRPDCNALSELRKWFVDNSDTTHVYYPERDEERQAVECPLLYPIKETVEIYANERSSETVRVVRIPERYSSKYSILIPNTDEAAKQMGAEVSYRQFRWKVVESTLREIIKKYPISNYSFCVHGLFDYSGEPVTKCNITYSLDSGMISVVYADLDEEINSYYPSVIDINNDSIPQIGSIVEYKDSAIASPVIAKVTSISDNMVRVVQWQGLIFQAETKDYNFQDDWHLTSYVYVPISACKLIPNIDLTTKQLRAIIRFEDENKLIQAPWGCFSIDRKIPFSITDIIAGLEKLRITAPEMIIRWIYFLSTKYIVDIDPNILAKASEYISLIESTDYWRGYTFAEQLKEGSVDYIGMIDELILEINTQYFPASDDIY